MQEGEEQSKHLDIDLHSPHGRIIRLILKKADFPNVDQFKKGFRFTVTIPVHHHLASKYYDDARYQYLDLDLEGIDLINDLYTAAFEDHFLSYVFGYVDGMSSRGSLKKAVTKFMKTYHLIESDIKFDTLIKMYDRADHPMKKSIYAKKNALIGKIVDEKPTKPLINRYIKK